MRLMSPFCRAQTHDHRHVAAITCSAASLGLEATPFEKNTLRNRPLDSRGKHKFPHVFIQSLSVIDMLDGKAPVKAFPADVLITLVVCGMILCKPFSYAC